MDAIRGQRESILHLINQRESKPPLIPAFLGAQAAALGVTIGAMYNTSGLPLPPVQCLNPSATAFGLRFYVPGVDDLGDTAHPIYNPDIALYGC